MSNYAKGIRWGFWRKGKYKNLQVKWGEIVTI